jgi:hypothetical protein
MSAFLFWLVVPCALVDTDSLNNIAGARKAEYDRLLDRGFYARVSLTEKVHQRDPALDNRWLPSNPATYYQYTIARKGIRTKWQGSEQPGAKMESEYCFDGENSWAREGERDIVLYRRANTTSDWLERGLPVFDPLSDAIGLESITCGKTRTVRTTLPNPFRVDLALETHGYHVVSSDVLVGGTHCVLVQCDGLDKMWLDPKKAYAVVRREWNWGEKMSIRVRISNEDIEQQSDGSWIPKKFQLEYFGTPETAPGTLCLTLQGTVQEFKAGISDDFTPDFTIPGQIIADAVTKQAYAIPKDSNVRLSDLLTPNGFSPQFAKVNKSGEASGALTYVIVGNLLFVAVLLLAVAIRGWQRRRSALATRGAAAPN